MRDAVIVEAVRTPVGKRNGGLSGVHPVDLSAHVLSALVDADRDRPGAGRRRRLGLRVAGRRADLRRRAATRCSPPGWPETVPGVTVDRQCGSSQQSVHFAAAGLIAGQYDVVVAGGVESMSRVPMGSSLGGRRPARRAVRGPLRRGDAEPGRRRGDDRRALGLLPRRSSTSTRSRPTRRRPRPARRAGSTRRSRRSPPPDGTVVSARRGHPPRLVGRDAGQPQDGLQAEDGVITAGNSSQISDGAAALLMTTSEIAPRTGPHPDRAGAHRRAGRRRPGHHADRADPGHPEGAGPQPGCRSTRSARSRSTRRSRRCRWPGWPSWAPTRKRLNPNGGAIALGHPLGGSGARLMTTLVHHMRDNGIRYGLQTMCEGGGQANATILELL